MNKGFLLAIGLLAGAIVGAGIFSLPYIFSRLGVVASFFYLIAFTFFYFLIHLLYARVLELNRPDHQFFYVARRYLKKPWSEIAAFVIFAEMLLVLVIYLILAPRFVAMVLPVDFIIALLIFWALGSIFIFLKLELVGWAEFFGIVGMLTLILLIFFAGGTSGIAVPKFKPLDLGLFFLPFGPLLFSLAGRPAIHKVVEEHRRATLAGRGFSLAKAVFWGTAIPALIYALFVLGVLRLNPAVGSDTVSSLGFLSPQFLKIFGALGFINIWTSYFIIGANIKDILRWDFKWSPFSAALFVLVVPLGLYFGGFDNFFEAISFAGGIFLALEGMFIIAIWRKAFPESPWRNFVLPLYLVFWAALLYEFASLIL
jgi:amino acid permease